MRAALCAGLLLAALAAINCGSSPTAPVVSVVDDVSLTPPPPVVLTSHYLFTVTVSTSCPTAGSGAVSPRTFEFELLPKFASGPFLVQPVNRLIDGPNSGSIMLLVMGGNPPGTALLDGTGLAADGVHIVGFGVGPTGVEGFAFLIPTTGAPPNEMTGDLQGAISVGVSNAAPSFCIAADHKYKLTPES